MKLFIFEIAEIKNALSEYEKISSVYWINYLLSLGNLKDRSTWNIIASNQINGKNCRKFSILFKIKGEKI